MKLKGKMRLFIGGLVAVMLMVLGLLAAYSCYTTIMDTTKNSMMTATELGGNQISALLETYENIATITGKDMVLASNGTAEAKANRIEKLADQYHFTSGNILDAKGVSLVDGTDFSDRAYVQKALNGETNISSITLSKYTGKYGFSVAAPVITTSGEINGVVYYRMDVDFMEAITDSMKVSTNSYTYIVDSDSKVIVHPDKELIDNYVVSEQAGTLGEIGKKIAAGEEGNATFKDNGVEYLCGYSPIPDSDWRIVIVAPTKDFRKASNSMLKQLAKNDIVLILIAVIIAGIYASNMSKKIVNVKDNLEKVAEGDFSQKLEKAASKDEIGMLTNTTYELQNTLKGIIGDTNKILGAMASYDLTSDDMKSYPGDFNRIAESVNNINAILTELIRDVKESANHVGIGSKELADAAENLSQGTVAQAGSIAAAANDIDDMALSVANISANGASVNEQLKELDQQILTGNEEMNTLLEIVGEIESMSNDIQKIVGAIDSIAFQTNILALNAAVEAASAGEAGKGFAVVADEIGNLANKSGESSKKTEELILSCIKKIKQAKESADTTSESLNRIVESSVVISEAFEKINKDTTEQALRSENVKNEVNNISDVIQNNTAAAEETAAASETLSEQAMNLNEMISKFRV